MADGARSFWTKSATCSWAQPSSYAPCKAGVRAFGQHPDRPSQRAGGGSDKPGSQAAREQELFLGRLVLPAERNSICLPPLREPGADEFFVAKFAACLNKPIDSIPVKCGFSKRTIGREIFGTAKFHR
jgi:hypothetical protein